MDRTARSQGLPLSLGLRRVATVALALATSAGVGTAVATTSHAAAHTPVAPVHAPIEPTASTIKSAYDFSTYIANVGGQDQIDACTGGLTKMVDVSKYMGRDYYPIHNECGGSPILNLVDGNTVHIDGLGDYTVSLP